MAPDWPPDTGASTKCRPRPRRGRASSRATVADDVVWSTRVDPAAIAEGAVRSRHDGPQVVIVADADEHQVGVPGRLGGARRQPAAVLAAQARALLVVRLKTVTAVA